MSHRTKNTVIDTNVIVSAFISRDGISARIYEMVLDGHIILYYCDAIMDEYVKVLNRPKFDIGPAEVEALTQALIKLGRIITPVASSIPLPDEKDRVFYDTAKQCNAVLVTGNAKHYPQEPRIMTPRAFYETYGA